MTEHLKGLMGWHEAFFCQEGWATQAGKAHTFSLSDLHLQTLQTPLCHCVIWPCGKCALCICRLRGGRCGIPAPCLFSSGIWWPHVSLIWKEWLLTKTGGRSSWSLSTLKRKGKIISKLVTEENSSIRSNKSTVGSFSFLISISNMQNP